MPRSSRLPLVRAAVDALLAIGLAVTPAHAQVARSWSVCYAGAQSCSDVFLTTTPQLVGATRTGTLVDFLVRHHDTGSFVTALQDVSLFFAPAGGGADAAPIPLTPAALFGAPAASTADIWSASGTSGAGAPINGQSNVLVVRDTTTPFRDAPALTPTQWIAACSGPLNDGFHASPLRTCGASAYGFAFTTAAQFDADQVSALATDVYVADAFGPDAPSVAFCRGSAAGGAGIGFDPTDPIDPTPCVVAPVVSAVPEPATLALCGGGLALLAGVGAVRRRARAAPRRPARRRRHGRPSPSRRRTG